ncbi:Cyclin [Hexamita inflata]|uniref:Cyclin n=1 Tax=Hexamita inflata TaxID=28002 RepID=A0AA86VSJ3_9EUKA|nr:Cyclin [Hexamita inflata]
MLKTSYEAYFESYTPHIENIQQYDVESPLSYMVQLANAQIPLHEYWVSKQFNYFNIEDRDNLIDWFERVAVQKKLPGTAVVRATYLLDLYYSKIPNAAKNILIKQSQTLSKQWDHSVIGGCIFDIASKVEGVKLFPAIIACFKCPAQELLEMQLQILQSLNYNVTMPTGIDFVVAMSTNLYQNETTPNICSPLKQLKIISQQITVSPINSDQDQIMNINHKKERLPMSKFIAKAAARVSIFQKNQKFISVSQATIGAAAVLQVIKAHRKDFIKQFAKLCYEGKIEFQEVQGICQQLDSENKVW